MLYVLSAMPVPFGYMFYDNTEIDSESCEECRGCEVDLEFTVPDRPTR